MPLSTVSEHWQYIEAAGHTFAHLGTTEQACPSKMTDLA
jgi:hypothetical protein